MNRDLTILVAASGAAFSTAVAAFFWMEQAKQDNRESANCPFIEEAFKAARDATPLPNTPPYDVLGRMVIDCRGLPADTRLSDL